MKIINMLLVREYMQGVHHSYKEEIDANDVVEDPLAVAARVNKTNAQGGSASGSLGVSPMIIVDDLKTMQLIRMVAPDRWGSRAW